MVQGRWRAGCRRWMEGPREHPVLDNVGAGLGTERGSEAGKVVRRAVRGAAAVVMLVKMVWGFNWRQWVREAWL